MPSDRLIKVALIVLLSCNPGWPSLAAAPPDSKVAQRPAAGPARSTGGGSPTARPAPTQLRPIKDKWAVVIGIDKFKDAGIPTLQWSAKDAGDFARFLVEKGNFAEDHVLLLTNEKATRDAIREAIGDNFLPRRVAQDDLVVIFASTHGSPKEIDIGGENFLIAYDTDPRKLFTTGIKFADLAPEIKNRTGCDRVVLLLDACNSGAASVGGKGLVRTGNFDVSSLAGAGQIVISSSAADQRSFESKRYDNGVFTKQLMAALQVKGEKTTLSDAFNHLKEQVENEVRFDRKLTQTPVMRSKWTGGELILIAVPSQPRRVEPEQAEQSVQHVQPESTGSADEMYRQAKQLVSEKKYAQALPLLLAGDAAGSARCQNYLAFLYRNGTGVPKNDARALELYKKAADSGLPRAQYNLGRLAEGGFGMPQNYGKAAEWYQKAADSGEVEAQRQLAIMYENGRGVPQNYEKACEWYQKAAEQGDGVAQCQLGLQYAQGHGVPQNDRKAVEWYEKDAAQGGRGGCFYLGFMYATGRGVIQSDEKAAQYYEKSAELGEPAAQNNLGVIYETGKGVSRDCTRAAHWFQKAADQGHAQSMCNLGQLYRKGLGVPHELSKARELFKRSSAAGYAPARQALKELGGE